MFWKLQSENFVIPLTCSWSTLRHYAQSGSFLDIARFPIKQSYIEEIPNFLDHVNNILRSGGIDPVSLEDIIRLQGIVAIQDEFQLLDEFVDLETNSTALALWLYSYLELRIPIREFDPKWTDAYHNKAISLINN